MPIGRTYTDSTGAMIFNDSVVENHKGQWIQHLSTTATMKYGYDLLGRLTNVQDGAGSVCTSRVYTYDAHTNRTGIGSSTGDSGAGCPTAAVTGTYTYDSADRLMTSPEGGAGTWLYDPFGRTTTMPTAAGTLKNAYYVNDLIASQTIAGQSQYSWTLDPIQRRSVNTQKNWNGTSWTTSAVKTSHYSNDSDEPTWISLGGMPGPARRHYAEPRSGERPRGDRGASWARDVHDELRPAPTWSGLGDRRSLTWSAGR